MNKIENIKGILPTILWTATRNSVDDALLIIKVSAPKLARSLLRSVKFKYE